MPDRDDQLRIDDTGAIHPLGRDASRELRAARGEWRLLPGTPTVLLLRHASESDRSLRVAGEIRTPGALSDIVALIAQSKWRGELSVVAGVGKRSIFFDGGAVAGAATEVPDERLGETLYRFGVITRGQLDAVVEASSKSGKRLGEAATDLGLLSSEELFPMMARQVEEVFYAALRVEHGVYYFFDDFDERRLFVRHNLNAGGLLMESARRMDEMRFFRERVPNEHQVPVPLLFQGEVPEEVAEVFDQCDGHRDIAEIGRRTGQLEFEVTRAIYQLVGGGFVRLNSPRPQGTEAIVEVFNGALQAIHEACDAAGSGDALRDGLARFATGGGVYDPLFVGAGPQLDGSLRPGAVERNLGALAGDDPDSWLIHLMQDYVRFAVFQAGSLLPRDIETSLVTRVGELLKPVAVTEKGPNSLRVKP